MPLEGNHRYFSKRQSFFIHNNHKTGAISKINHHQLQ